VCAGRIRGGCAVAGVTETLFKAAGFDLVAADRIEYERIVEHVRCVLEADIVEAAWANGRMMTLEQAMAYALGETAAHTWNV
jgi:hypothetical protein